MRGAIHYFKVICVDDPFPGYVVQNSNFTCTILAVLVVFVFFHSL